MIASRACPPSLTGSWPRRPATPTSQRLGPLQGMPDARPITLIRIGPRGAAGERSLLPHFQIRFCSINRHSSMPLQCLKCANGLNRSRGRALRRAAWPCQQWMERWSVLPDDEGPEARPQNRRSFSMMIARSIIDGVGSAPTAARRHLHRGCFEYPNRCDWRCSHDREWCIRRA